MEEKGQKLDASEVEREIRERDRRDSTRADSPLVRAKDAVSVDTTPMSIEQVEQAILEIIQERITR
jgi:cytidylate kinase